MKKNINAIKRELETIEQQFNEAKNKRIAKVYKNQMDKAASARAKKIHNAAMDLRGSKIWAEVNVNIWSGSGRRVRFAGTETIVGCITWESKTGSSFCIKNQFGRVREIRKYNSYKEFKRKPKN